MKSEDTIACRAPGTRGEGVTRVPAWKYHAVRRAILHAVGAAGADGLPVSELAASVRARMSQADLARLGALGWHCTTVKLEMEVAGEIARLPASSGPERLVLGQA